MQLHDTAILSLSYHKETDKTDLRNSYFEIQKQEKYQEVFESNCGFIANLSILDLLFNLGPESSEYLFNVKI